MKVSISIHRYTSMATVRFHGTLPAGFRELEQVFTNSIGEVQISCDPIKDKVIPTGKPQYHFFPAQVACDFLRDNGYELEEFGGNNHAPSYKAVIGDVSA